jgi:hypothetical protein
MGSARQFFGHAAQQFGGKRMSATHGVFCVVIEHDADRFGVQWIGVTGLQHKNFCGIHFHPRS